MQHKIERNTRLSKTKNKNLFIIKCTVILFDSDVVIRIQLKHKKRSQLIIAEIFKYFCVLYMDTYTY